MASFYNSNGNFEASGRGYGRGRGRGTGRGRGRGYSTPPVDSGPPRRNFKEGLESSPLKTIQIPPAPATKEEIRITDVEYLGSYNWKNAPRPTIVVPGSPARWVERSFPFSVPADTGLSFVDQNANRYPDAPLLPLFRAIDHLEHKNGSQFEWSSVDFVTDRNGLRKLLRWLNGSAEKDFRIDMQLAGHTILFTRWEARNQEMMSGYTYGFNFEKAATRVEPDCAGTHGHHRIVTYDFDGLRMVVRFEVDGFFQEGNGSSKPASGVDDLADALAGVDLSSLTAPDTDIKIISGGAAVDQSSLLELTTRSVTRAADYDWPEAYPQLFLSQTPHHFLAVHNRGNFQSVQKRKLGTAELDGVGRGMQGSLKRLRTVLGNIREIVVGGGQRGRFSLVCDGGVLKLFERVDMKSCLPDEVMERFEE